MNRFTVSAHRADNLLQYPGGRTVKCWNSHALMMLVASFGKIPRFFCCLCPFVSESSSAVPSPDPILLSKPSPADTEQRGNSYNSLMRNVTQNKTDIPYQLRTRSHRMTLINKTKFLNDTDFIIRLYCTNIRTSHCSALYNAIL